MRPIGLDDVFAWSEIIDKLDLTEKITQIQIDSEDKNDPVKWLGVQFMALIFTKIYKVKKEIINWLSDVTGKTIEETQKMSLKDMKDHITEFMKSDGLMELFTSLVSEEPN